LLQLSLSPAHSRYLKEAYGYLILSSLWLASHLSRMIGYRHPYWALQSYFLKKTRLLDEDFYLRIYLDVEQQAYQPIYHFAAFGDKESRQPNPLFDPRFYKSKARGRLKNVNSLLHYFYIGQYRRYSPSAWFDIQFYIARNRDVFNSGYEPLRHYLEFGGLEGRSPNPQFDGSYYLQEHPEIASARTNPLIHYLEYGRWHGLPTRDLSNDAGNNPYQNSKTNQLKGQKLNSAEDCYQQIIANQALWSEKNKTSQAEVVVDVIIPVYKNASATLQCIASVLHAKENTAFEVIVINDDSPEKKLTEYLHNLSELHIITLIQNPDNRGFVYSANLGMQLHPERDIVLLNSDTQVFGNWIERLRAASAREPLVASVTPLSNNATICSYPRTLYDNPYPLEISYERLDSLTAQVNKALVVEAPTAIGFCMYIKRAAINLIGIFDLKAFGIGYGEENDWCQRAIKAGWKNLLTADTFVYHIGNASFGGSKDTQLSKALKILAKRYPRYHQDIQSFIRNDPLKTARERLDWARLELQSKETNTLMVSHNRGGGSERHLQEDAQQTLKQGQGVFYLRPVRGKPNLVRIEHGLVKQLLNTPHFEFKDINRLAKKLGALNITTIQNHGLVDYEAQAPLYLARLATQMQATYIVDIHDYTVICPRINLVDQSGIYCGEPIESQCNRCLKESPNDFGVTSIKEWRQINYQSLRNAQSVYAPSKDALVRIQKYYPKINIEYRPHAINENQLDIHRKGFIKELPKLTQSMRVLIIGAISNLKGFEVLLGLAQDAKERKLPLEFILQGYSKKDQLLEKYNVMVIGRYSEDESVALTESINPDLILYPSIWPETYSYTLDVAFLAKIPVMAFNIGAIPERLKENNSNYKLISLDNAFSPRTINAQILGFHQELKDSKNNAICI
jgi:O-antigen biosynthesis protein